MFMNYPIQQWIDLGLYLIGVSILFTFVGLLSCYLNNKYFNINKIKVSRKKNIKEKKWFYDVA